MAPGAVGFEGDVNIAEVGGVTVVGTLPVSVVGGVTIQEPLSVDDNGGSLTVDGTVSVSGGVTLAATRAENSAFAAGHETFPAGVLRDDVLGTLGAADDDFTNLRVSDRGALWIEPLNDALGGIHSTKGALRTGPDRSTITNLFSAEVFDNTQSSANSSSVDVTEARWILIYLVLTESGNATDIRFIAQFSRDGGTTWCDYAVDQWVDLRYVDPQMPLNECIPLNYVGGSLFRLRAVARGVSASNTFTVTADVEAVS